MLRVLLAVGVLVGGTVSANVGVGGFGRYQAVSDGDDGYGAGALVEYRADGLVSGAFFQLRASYLTGFGDGGLDLDAIPLEVGLGMRRSVSDDVSLYAMILLGYFFMDVDSKETSVSVIRVDGRPIDTGRRVSYDVDDAIGFAIAFGGEWSLSDHFGLFGEVRYQQIKPEVERTVTGGAGTTRVGNITIIQGPGGTSSKKFDLGGVGAAAGLRWVF